MFISQDKHARMQALQPTEEAGRSCISVLELPFDVDCAFHSAHASIGRAPDPAMAVWAQPSR